MDSFKWPAPGDIGSNAASYWADEVDYLLDEIETLCPEVPKTHKANHATSYQDGFAAGIKAYQSAIKKVRAAAK